MRKLILFCMAIILVGFIPTGSTAFGKVLFGNNSMVKQKCAACHKPDPKGNLEVMEETRKSTEEWKMVVDRMTRLHDVPLNDEEFHGVVKELSNHLMLTPKEMSQIAYINSNENSQYREIPRDEKEEAIFNACVRCHTWGKMASHRYTKPQWNEVRTLHLAYYPTAVLQLREMNWPQVFADLIDPLHKRFPFNSPEWKNWMQKRSNPDLSGSWRIAGYRPGLGYYTGSYEFRLAPEKGKDEYLINKTISYENGKTETTNGTGTLYGGYHLLIQMDSVKTGEKIEGVFDLNADDYGFNGKWWQVVQDENIFGNERFYPTNKNTQIVGVFPQSIQSGTSDPQKLKIVGVNLPSLVTPADVHFSIPHVEVKQVARDQENNLVASIMVKKGAANGPVQLRINDIAYGGSLIVYSKIEGITVFPRIGRARVSGGPAYPPQGVQFVARAIHFGKDGDENTDDDLMLEPVDATWKLEEEDTSVSMAMKALRVVGVYPKFGRETDDDLKYLDTAVENGLYVPITTYAPVKEREQNNQATGLIAIKATVTVNGKEYEGRSKLAVTVPDYVPHIK